MGTPGLELFPPRSTRLRRQAARFMLLGGALAAAGIGAAALGGCGGANRTTSVSAFPIPGGRVASPQTQIVFRGLPISRLGRVVVTGSHSGRHAGKLLADSDGRGGSFVPSRPFAPGERVTVATQVHVRGAPVPRRGTRQPQVGSTFSFTVAQPAGALPDRPLTPATREAGDVMSFRSRPDLTPAAVKVLQPAADPAAGDLFVAPQQGPVQNGPMIVDPSGQLVWFHPLPGDTSAADFRVQTYRGQPALTWWQGHVGAGVGAGDDVIFDSSYRQVAEVHGGNGLSADLHEFQLTRDGNALITAYYPVYWDASSVRGSRHAIVLDSVVQEIDLKTGLVMFQWDSLDHVPLSDSYQPLPTQSGNPYDYFHVNSIQPDRDGDLVVSARNTWAAYKINAGDGRLLWAIGGRHSTFKLPAAATFAFQHQVRVRDADDQTITVFDDGAGPPNVHHQSRGLVLRLDFEAKRATLVQQVQHSPPLLASFEGSVQELPNGDYVLGWGQQPYFSEFDPSGGLVFDGRFIDAVANYRAYRFPWSASPTTPPALAAVAQGTSTTLYASWNGATAVASWQVLDGTSQSALRPVTSAARHGFETTITVPRARFVAVRALDRAGHTLGTSPTIAPS